MQTRSRSSLSRAPQPLDRAANVPGAEHQAPAARAKPNTGALPPQKALSQLYALEGGSQIERWQESFASETTHEDEGVTTRLFRACLDSLTCILEHTDVKQTSKREKNILQRCQATLKLWGDGHGVWDGSLDHILDRSKNLQHMTLAILNPLCKTLSNGMKKHVKLSSEDASMVELYDRTAEIYAQTKWLLSGFHETTAKNDSDSDSDSSSGDDVEYAGIKSIAEDVKTYTNCLVDLSAALECPAIDPVHEDEPSQLVVEQRSAQDYHSDLIRAKFPDAKAELVQCLGETSWSRYQRMQQQRDTANVQANSQSGVKSHAADSEFQDSGLGTSLPSVAVPTSYAETIVSFMTSITGGKRVQIPPLSAEAKRGAKFECVACGRHVRVTTNRDWRKHLFLDLQPYTCFYANCAWSSQPFADRQLWSNHLELDHKFGPDWNGVECPLCLEVIESGKNAILIHFARHMEDISLAALPRDVDSEAESGEGDDSASDGTASSVGPATNEPFYPCKICISQVAETGDLVNHLRETHRVPQDSIEGSLVRVSRWHMIIVRIEYLFSDENLRTDYLLCNEMDTDGFVSLGFIFRERMGPLLIMYMDQFPMGCHPSNVFVDGLNFRIRQKSGWERWIKDQPSPVPVRDPLHKLRELLDKKARDNGQEPPDRTQPDYWNNPDYARFRQSLPGGLSEQEQSNLARYDPTRAVEKEQSRRSLAPKANHTVWESHRDIIQRLYITEKRPLKVVRDVMARDHGFDASVPQYERYLKRWALRKNTRSQERNATLSHVERGASLFSNIIKCICGSTDSDGATVLCQKCNTWQHILCFYESHDYVYDNHQCIDCRAREADREAATRKQTQRLAVTEVEAQSRRQPRRSPRRTLETHTEAWVEENRSHPKRPAASTPAYKSGETDSQKRPASSAPPRPAQVTPLAVSAQPFSLRCMVCNESYWRRADYDNHLLSDNHINQLRLLQDSFGTKKVHESADSDEQASEVVIGTINSDGSYTCNFPGCSEILSDMATLFNHTNEHKVTSNRGPRENAQELPRMPTGGPVDPGITHQVPDFKQWAFKPDVSGITDTASTSSQPLSQPISGRAGHGVETTPTALSSEPTNQDQKSNRKGKTACAECRASHMKCNFGRPCANCVKRKLPTCTYEAATYDTEVPVIDLKEYAYKPVPESFEADATRTRLPQTYWGQSPERYPGITIPPNSSQSSLPFPTTEYFSGEENLSELQPLHGSISLREVEYEPLELEIEETDDTELHEDIRASWEENNTKKTPRPEEVDWRGPQEPKAPLMKPFEREDKISYVRPLPPYSRPLPDIASSSYAPKDGVAKPSPPLQVKERMLDESAVSKYRQSMAEESEQEPWTKHSSYSSDPNQVIYRRLLDEEAKKEPGTKHYSHYIPGAHNEVPPPLPPPRQFKDLENDHHDSGDFDLAQSMRTRDWEAPVGDGWVNIAPPSESHDPQSPPRPSFWTNNDYGSGPSASGDNELLAEVQRLRQENEEKDVRLRQLEEAVDQIRKLDYDRKGINKF